MSNPAKPHGGTLVIQPLPGIGDMVWHLPHLHALASLDPGQRITLLTKPRSMADQLLRGDPSIERVLWLKRERGGHGGMLGFLRLVMLLRRQRFQRVIILHPSARYALAAFLAAIPERIGYGGAQGPWLNTPARLTSRELKAHPIDKADALLRELGLKREAEPKLRVNSQTHDAVMHRYVDATQDHPRPWIAIGIGSSEHYKQWGVENFIGLISSLAGKYGGSFFLFGGPAELEMAQQITKSVAVPCVPIMGEALDAVTALLSECRFYIGNDTGILNLAAAAGIPALGLFGATRPLSHSTLIHPILPEGCMDGSQVQRGGDGMRQISVDHVLRHLSEI